MSNLDVLKDRLLKVQHFKKRNIEQIILEENSDFSIIDDVEQAYIVNKDNSISTKKGKRVLNENEYTKLFHVKNVKRVLFIPVDGKNGLLGFGTSFCDCILIDCFNFSFIEFKFNATSEKKITENRAKAINQIQNTLDFFDKELEQNYNTIEVEAIIATPPFYPRGDAEWRNFAVAFLEKNGIQIFENTTKICKVDKIS